MGGSSSEYVAAQVVELMMGVLVVVVVAVVVRGVEAAGGAGGAVPALWIFGDSLADAGNNNAFRTLAKANHPPYGRDFPGRVPTGRFFNGFTALDYLAFRLGLPLAPIYENVSMNGHNLLQGVNFASGASGIQPYTGLNFGKVTSMDAQIQQFALVKEQIVEDIGDDAATKLFGKSLFYIVTGSNDWLNTYFFPASPLRTIYTISEYRDLLITRLLSQIEDLYNLGARRIAVAGLGALGCSPSQLRAYKSTNGSCISWLNQLCQDYNEQLRPSVFSLPTKLPNSSFVFHNIYTPVINVLHNPSAFGFSITNHACCGIGKYGGFLNCFQGFPVCEDEENYLYWDAYHPTSKFCKLLVDLLWNNGPPYSYPRSGRQMLMT